MLSQKGVKTAILDLTKNKNSYYMFTDNDTNLMKIATESISNLSGGIVNGLEVNKNLTVFTSLPDGLQEETNKDMMLKTLSLRELKYKLLEKGLDKKLVEKYIEDNREELEEYEKKCIEKIRRKKAGNMEEEKINQYLFRKGYPISKYE